MKLIQKFYEKGSLYDLEIDPKQCEIIADEFAVSFGLWLTRKGNYNINNWNKSMEEKLEIYKKENGL